MRDFPKSVRRAAYTRADGHCEACGSALVPGAVHYDHVIPYALRRDSSLQNCQVLCRNCHGVKTATKDVPEIARAVRIADKAAATRQSAAPMPAGRKSSMRKTLAGAVVPRVSQAERHREFMARRYFKEEGE